MQKGQIHTNLAYFGGLERTAKVPLLGPANGLWRYCKSTFCKSLLTRLSPRQVFLSPISPLLDCHENRTPVTLLEARGRVIFQAMSETTFLEYQEQAEGLIRDQQRLIEQQRETLQWQAETIEQLAILLFAVTTYR